MLQCCLNCIELKRWITYKDIGRWAGLQPRRRSHVEIRKDTTSDLRNGSSAKHLQGTQDIIAVKSYSKSHIHNLKRIPIWHVRISTPLVQNPMSLSRWRTPIGLHSSLSLLLGYLLLLAYQGLRSHAKAIHRDFLALRLYLSATRKRVICIRRSIELIELLRYFIFRSIIMS